MVEEKEVNELGFRVKFVKRLMDLFPSKPVFDVTDYRSEIINHKHFINKNEDEKNQFLYKMAKIHYLMDQNKPFDHYFPGYSLKRLLTGKKVLDLGCWCGGKTVSYAERWNVESMYGIDINEFFIKATVLFSSNRKNKNIPYHFVVGVGEALPYENDAFDAIVCCNVFEHLKSVRETIRECKRTLKSGGMLFSVFPSYLQPFGGAHLDLVTKMPCLQWFFNSKTIKIAHNEILESRGEEAYWYKSKKNEEDNYGWSYEGIRINGITLSKFKSIVEEVGFSEVIILPTPLFSVGSTSIRYPKIKYLSKALKPLLNIESLQDYLSHRIVSILYV